MAHAPLDHLLLNLHLYSIPLHWGFWRECLSELIGGLRTGLQERISSMLLVGVNVQDSITTFPLQTFRLSLPLYAQLYIQMRDCLGLIDSRQYLGLFIISPRALRPAVECLRIPTFLYPFPILDLISWVFPLRWNIAFSDRNLQLQNFFTMCSKITAQPLILLQ